MAPRSRPHSGLKFPIYKDEVLDRIIEAGGGLPQDDREVDILIRIEPGGEKRYERLARREALRLCLEGAAEQYLTSFRSGPPPTQAMLANRYRDLEKAPQKLLKLLGKPEKPPSKPHRISRFVLAELGVELAGGVPSLEALSGVRVQDIIQINEELLRCATRLRAKHSVEPDKPPIAHSGDVSLDEVIRWLGHAWLLVFEDLPGSSVDAADGTVGGPFIDFVRAALEPLLEEVPSEDAVRARFRRVLGSFRPRGMAKSD